MSFTRANTLGWALYEVLTSAQMNALDIDHAKAIDGTAGGAYAPSSPITLTTGATRIAPGVGTVEYSAGAYPKLSSRTIQRHHPLDLLSSDNDETMTTYGLPDFTYSGTSKVMIQDYADTGLTPTNPWYVSRFTPDVAVGTITQLDYYVDPGTGRAGIPASPIIYKLLCSTDGGAYTELDSMNDDKGTLPTYEVWHYSTSDGLSIPINRAYNKSYLFQLWGEGGTNAQVGCKFHSVLVTYTVDTIYP